jgi:protein involved in polysaccharide export with SLBB domain
MRLKLSFFAQLTTFAAIAWGQPAAPVPAAAQAEEFRLSPGDAVEVKFFYAPELNDSFQIRPDGRVSFPLIGEVLLAGRTVSDVSGELHGKYKPILKNPAVNLNVRSFASQKIFVSGEVNKPGTIPLPGQMTVLQAISDAGGLKYTAAKSQIILVRRGQTGEQERVPVLLDSKLTNAPAGTLIAATTQLRPFDVILVPESKIARTDRWIDQHIRQLLPATLSAGFSYLFNPIAVR